ncbi:MAG: thioredoxin domain-containing protein [Draconibacterium sp.]
MMKQLFSCFVFVGLLVLGSCSKKSSDKSFETIKHEVTQKSGDVILSDDSAPKTVFIYASYNCDFCRYFFSRTYPDLKSNYLDNGKLKLVIKWVDFQDNPQVLYSLQAASCIGRFGIYEKFHQLLLVNPGVVFTNDFVELVDDIMEDNSEIAQCILQNNEYEYLRGNVKEFRNNNLSGTPTFVLNNHAYSGFISYDNFKKLLKKEFDIE